MAIKRDKNMPKPQSAVPRKAPSVIKTATKVPKKQMIKARPAVISELYEMEPLLLKEGWEKKSQENKGQDLVITFIKDEYSRFIITCEPLHITWRRFDVNENGEMIRKSLILGVIHYDIKKLEYLKFI